MGAGDDPVECDATADPVSLRPSDTGSHRALDTMNTTVLSIRILLRFRVTVCCLQCTPAMRRLPGRKPVGRLILESFLFNFLDCTPI